MNGKLQGRKGKNRIGKYSKVIVYTRTEQERNRIVDGAQVIMSSTGVSKVTVELAENINANDFTHESVYQRMLHTEHYRPQFRFIE